MKKLKTIYRALALLLCAVFLCVPLMGMTPATDSGAPIGSSGSADALGEYPEDCELCPLSCEACHYQPMPQSAGASTYRPKPHKCTANCKLCDTLKCCVCKPVPCPDPVCNCTVKCEKGAINKDCTVCEKSIKSCKGKTPEPAPICGCTVKCKTGAVKDDCAVCKKDIAGCVGKEPEPVPVCACAVKCVAGAVNTACPICKIDLTGCKGKEATSPPIPTGSYNITIVAPSGWYTKAANVEIRVEDVNGTGWKKVEARIERNGSWLDLTDDMADTSRAKVEITENCTLYVTVTGKDGKAATKSRYIECFDRAAPTIKTGLDGKVLRVEAVDELSGVEAIYIDGDRYTGPTNGTLDVRLRDLSDDYEQISIQAVDYAGNKSKTAQVKNPNYKAPSSSKPVDKPATTPTPEPPKPTTPPATSGSSKPSTGSSTSGGTATAKPEPADPKPFTPDGTGTVVDNATGEDGKEFFTIMTPSENVFYLVIDRQRTGENVYFLNAVTEADLLALAEITAKPEPVPTPEPPRPEPTPEEEQPPVEEPPAKKSNTGLLIVALLVVLAGGGAVYYFKVIRPKQQGQPDEELDEAEYAEEQDNSPPWDVEDETPEEGSR